VTLTRVPMEPKRLGLANWIAVLALCVSIVSIVLTYHQGAHMRLLEQETAGMAYRPQLSVFTNPVVECVLSNPTLLADANPDTGTIAFNLRVDCTLHMVNKGNSPARLLAYAWSDTAVGTPALRKFLLDPSRRRNLRFEQSSDFYGVREVRPADTLTVAISQPVSRTLPQYFVLHYVVLYENDTGQLYDTYFWARYVLPGVVAPARPSLATPGRSWMYVFAPSDMIRLLDTNESSIMYNPEQAKEIVEAIKKAP